MNISIEEGNEIIARFMNLKVYNNGMYDDPTKDKLSLGLYYNSDWNWLMMVVEKIETLNIKYVVTIKNSSCDIHNVFIKDKDINIYNAHGSKLECTYQSVIEFIKWWNSQQKT